MTRASLATSYHETTVTQPNVAGGLYGEEDILDTLCGLRLEEKDYFLIGGANLVLRGILDDTSDIDMLVSDRGFGVLAQELGAKLKDPPPRALERGATNRTIWVRNSETRVPISAATELGDGYYPQSFETHKSKTERIGGVPCIRLKHIIASKEALLRRKDVEHLNKINAFLGRSATRYESQPAEHLSTVRLCNWLVS